MVDFFERMRQVISQGLETTRRGMEQAADKARELGERGVLRYEISRLERDVEARLALLGGHVYRLLVEKGQNTISAATPDVKELIAEVSDLRRRIEDKEKALEAISRG